MKLKCIGGELDGYQYEVSDYHLKEGELVKLPKPVSGLSIVSDPDTIPDMIEMNTLYYKVLTLHFNEKTYHSKQYYLIPMDWSFREAVLYQFGK